MGWCPNCKNEFIEGITICPKCDVMLAETLEKAERMANMLASGGENMAEVVANMDKGSDSSKDSTVVQSMSGSYTMSALPMVSSLMGDSTDSAVSAEEVQKAQAEAAAQARRAMVSKRVPPKVYQDKNVQAKEMKNSAYSLILVGVLGLVFVGLVFTNVINLNQAASFKTMFTVATGIFFLALTVMGFMSIKSFKVLEKSASEEDQVSAQIEKWYKENMTAERIDHAVKKYVNDNDPEEEKYFYRSTLIKAVLTENFVNLDDVYVDHIVEEIYSYLYE